MASTFHVFVDGAVDPSQDGLKVLANAMASRYGLQAGDLANRLARGRFRVKANVDKATAESYRRDLVAIGARVTIEEANAANSMATGPVPKATPPAGVKTSQPISALPPRQSQQIPTQAPASLPPRGPATTKPPATGLAAASSFGSSDDGGLGALSNLDSLSLASLDGNEEPPPIAKPAPPPAAAAAKPAKKAKPVDTPLDLFAPPEMQGAEAELKVDLAPEEEERHQRKKMSVPPPPAVTQDVPKTVTIPVTPVRGQPMVARSGSAGPRSAAEGAEMIDAAAVDTVARHLVSRSGGAGLAYAPRLVIGALLAIGIGFVPAHFIAASREKSAFKAVDDKVLATQAQVDSIEAYASLDKFRSDQIDRKKSDRRNIALMAIAIWALVGSGVAYVWFRKIPWDRS